MTRPSYATINLDNLRSNFNLAQELSGNGQALAVIKADAYGHGAIQVAKALESLTPAMAVACIEEGLVLRSAGITCPILLLEGAFDKAEVVIASENKFWLMVGSKNQLDDILGSTLKTKVHVWLKIDTGMHRFGIQPNETKNFYHSLQTSANVEDDIVLATHFACGDELENNFTKDQTLIFDEAVSGLKAASSLANSAAILAWEDTRRDWNRAGVMLFGHSPFDNPHVHADRLLPVMTLKAGIIDLRELAVGETVGYGQAWQAERPSRIATVSIGYGDGYPRHARCGTPVSINGNKAALVGRVSMDMITIDVTDIDNASLGDEVELWGDDISLSEVAASADTISYELLAGMPNRVPRVYVG